MQIFKYKFFHQWAKAEGLTDETLQQAVEEMNKGLYEADLGGGLYKKRIAMPGKGKRGSYRTLIAFKREEKAFFIYGFSKNKMGNIKENEKTIYKKLAKDVLDVDTHAIRKMLNSNILIEVK